MNDMANHNLGHNPANKIPAERSAVWITKLTVREPGNYQPSLRWSKYETFSLRIVLLLSGMMLLITAGLHFYNYNLETLSSSTSGSHSDFYKDTGAD